MAVLNRSTTVLDVLFIVITAAFFGACVLLGWSVNKL